MYLSTFKIFRVNLGKTIPFGTFFREKPLIRLQKGGFKFSFSQGTKCGTLKVSFTRAKICAPRLSQTSHTESGQPREHIRGAPFLLWQVVWMRASPNTLYIWATPRLIAAERPKYPPQHNLYNSRRHNPKSLPPATILPKLPTPHNCN